MRLSAALVAVVACSSAVAPRAPGTPALQLVTAALSGPVFVTAPQGDSARLFVVEQGGRVRVIRRDSLLATPFLDLRGKISSGGERGLLSLAFHPQYATNGPNGGVSSFGEDARGELYIMMLGGALYRIVEAN